MIMRFSLDRYYFTGTPNLKFFDAMESEHCTKFGSKDEDMTSNYKIWTSPSIEWRLVIKREGKSDSEGNYNSRFENILKKEFPNIGLGKEHHNRRIPDIALLLLLPTSIAAKLTRVEIIAIVLYTGPMVSPFLDKLLLAPFSHSFSFQFQWYNTILRQDPMEKYLKFANGGNLFTTTIFVLVSAVQKLSRAVKMADGTLLYRGLGGLMDLPDGFRKPDAQGCLGYAEWAFMSTTADRDVAIKYSGVADGKPKAKVLVIRTGAVDRGACLQEYSQYQEEYEYLWLPLSFLQPERGGSTIEVTQTGLVSMVHVRVIPNHKTSTIEEAVGKKKSMHMAAFNYLVEELSHHLENEASKAPVKKRFKEDLSKNQGGVFTLELMIKSIVDECKARLAVHAAINADEFVGDEKYRGLVTEMLDLQTMAKSKFRLWLEDKTQPICFFNHFPIRTAQRQLIAYLHRSMQSKEGQKRRQAAFEVCKLRLLVRDRIDEENENHERPLLTAAADGAGLQDLKALIIASGADEVSVTSIYSSKSLSELLIPSPRVCCVFVWAALPA